MANSNRLWVIITILIIVSACNTAKHKAMFEANNCKIRFADSTLIYKIELYQNKKHSVKIKPLNNDEVLVNQISICNLDENIFLIDNVNEYKALDFTKDFLIVIGMKEKNMKYPATMRYFFSDSLFLNDHEIQFVEMKL